MKKNLMLLIFSLFFLFCFADEGVDSEFDFMHSASFTFKKEVPFIRAHVKSYPSGIEVNGISSFVCGDKKYAATSFKLSSLKYNQPEILYKLSFHELSQSELKNYASMTSEWRQKSGLNVDVFVNGAIFSINKSRIDNREYYIAATELFSKEAAYDLLSKYRELFPENNISMIPVMTKASSSLIQVVTGKGKYYNCKNIVSVNSETSLTVDKDTYKSNVKFFFTGSSNGKVELAVEDSVENLVEKILPGEMFLSAPLETLKAQAVAARTDIFMQLGKRHVSEPWHICSEVHCQKILWGNTIEPKFIQAVKETEGEVLIFQNLYIARAPYCSTSGGKTEDIRNVWFSAEKPYLKGVWDGENPMDLDLSAEDDFIKFLKTDYGEDNIPMNKRHRWKIIYQQEELDEILNKSFNIGVLKSIKAVKRGISGRIYQIIFIGDKGSRKIYGELNIRKVLNNMYSSAFIITKDEGKWVFSGAGWGHGVGMSQMGAISLGQKNKDFKYILKRYYPGTDVIKIY